jgi:hypothetical protein
MTIYVPDDLWRSATGDNTDINASGLVQDGLRALIAQRRRVPSFAQERPLDAAAAITEARDRMVKEARAQYERGYGEGAKAAAEIPWAALDRLAMLGWDLRSWMQELADLKSVGAAFQAVTGGDLRGYLQDELQPWEPVGNPTYEMGFADALRDVWQAVRGGDQPDMLPKERELADTLSEDAEKKA